MFYRKFLHIFVCIKIDNTKVIKMLELTPITLKSSVLDNIRLNKRIRNRLQLELNKSYPTVQRYFDDNNPMLTTATALRIISEETGIPQSELLEN